MKTWLLSTSLNNYFWLVRFLKMLQQDEVASFPKTSKSQSHPDRGRSTLRTSGTGLFSIKNWCVRFYRGRGGNRGKQSCFWKLYFKSNKAEICQKLCLKFTHHGKLLHYWPVLSALPLSPHINHSPCWTVETAAVEQHFVDVLEDPTQISLIRIWYFE